VILHPAIIALLTVSALTAGMVVFASHQALRILRRWDLSSGSELQLRLERRTYLISSILSYAFVFQLAALFLFVRTADSLCTLFTGAMCAAGTLGANVYGYPALGLKIAVFLLAGVWLIVNHADNQACDYPLLRTKYRLLLAIAPFVVAEAALSFAFFLGLKADVITSCCGSLFGRNAGNLAADIVALPPRPTVVALYAALALVFASGGFFLRTGRAGYLFSAAAVTAAALAVASVLSSLSVYVYELPTHHCPFCVLQREYRFIGYPLYAAIFGGAVCGAGVGVLLPSVKIASLAGVVPALQRRLCVVALLCDALLALLVTYEILSSNLTL